MNEVEIISKIPEHLDIKYALFDHDGTISTLREGWKDIMETMMVEVVLGKHKFQHGDIEIYDRVLHYIRDYIDRTMGQQTLVLMEGIVKVIRFFGYVDEKDILSIHEYKDMHNSKMNEMVNARIEKIRKYELVPSDFHIKNVQAFLSYLVSKVKLYLFSGNDHDAVIKEAVALYHYDFFDGRVYGSGTDVTVEVKQQLLEDLIDEGIDQAEIVVFGDGPVEIKAAKYVGALAVGVASTETRRFGLNKVKRKTLIDAGADIIISDYSQLTNLLGVLGFKDG